MTNIKKSHLKILQFGIIMIPDDNYLHVDVIPRVSKYKSYNDLTSSDIFDIRPRPLLYENPKLFAKDLESILNIVKTIRAEKREKIVSIIIYNPTPIFSAVFFLLHNRVEQREQKRFP